MIDLHDMMVDAIAMDMERALNIGRRVFAVDRASLRRTYDELRVDLRALSRFADDGGRA